MGNSENNLRLGERVEEYLVDLFRNMYYKEIDSENAFISNLGFTSGIIIALGGAGTYLFLNFPQFNMSDSLHIFFSICFGFIIIFFILTLYYFIRATTGYEYEYIETSTEIYTYASSLREYYDGKSIKSENIDTNLINDLRIHLLTKYSSACSNNAANNDKKWENLRHTYLFIILLVIILIIATIPFSLVHRAMPEIQKIEIINK